MKEERGKTILLVEDEPLIALNERMILERNGYRIILASTGEEAVRMVERNRELDLVLMDINLGPGIDGTEAARRILALREIPLAFLSSHTEPAVVEKAERISSYGYIVKNSGETVLLASIAMVFRLFEAKLGERRKAEALRESEARYRRLVEHSPDIVYVFSDQRGGLYYSPAVERVLGYRPEELLAQPFLWNESIHPENRALIAQRVHQAAEGQAFSVEYRIKDSRGEWKWLLDRSTDRFTRDGETVIEGLATDITARKWAEEAAAEREEVFRLFLEHSPIYVFFKDEAIRALRLSRNFEQLVGLPLEAQLGKSMDELFPAEFAAKMVEDDRRILAEGKAVEILEEFGGKIYRTTKFPIQRPGKPELLAGFTIDVTEMKRAEERIAALLAEKELILRETHHRIKNDMEVVRSLLNLQAEAQEEDSVPKTVLEAAAGRVQSMSVLYDRLYRSRDFLALDLRDFLGSLVGDLVETYAGAAEVRADLDITSCPVRSETLAPLGLIVNELVSNSMKYAFKGRARGSIGLSATQGEGRILLSYRDSGPGLPLTVGLGNSPGFGLSLVELLVKQIGGGIRLERGTGTVFLIEFPL